MSVEKAVELIGTGDSLQDAVDELFAGADVAAGYSGNQEAAEKFAQDFTDTFPDRKVSVHRGDIGSAEDCRRCVAEVVDQHGRLDVLVNNAGITVDRTVAKMVDADWSRVIDVNLSGAFYLSQAALKHMLERGSGRIVMISSVIGETGGIGQVNYASAKSGLFGLTKTLAREAAMQLYLERGFEQTTVAEIAKRAGLTARTFFRYFADKREVLFGGSEALQEAMVEALDAAPDDASPLQAVTAALDAAAEKLIWVDSGSIQRNYYVNEFGRRAR